MENKQNTQKRSPVTRLLSKLYGNKTDGAIRPYDVNTKGTQALSIIIGIICVIMILVVMFPMIWVVLAGFKDIKEIVRGATILPSTFNFENYATSWGQLKFGQYYVNSFIIVIGGSFCAIVFNGLLAYALGVLKPPGHKFVFGLVMWTLLIPPTTSIVAQFLNIHHAISGFGGLLGIEDPGETILQVVPLWLIMGANAFWLVLFKQFFEDLPQDFVEAARLDGCSDFGIFTRIILPLSRPIVMVVLIFSATAAWSDFLLPTLLLGNSPWETVMVRLFEFRSAIKVTDADRLRAVVFAIIPPIIIFAAFQKQITNGVVAGGIKG